MDPSSLIPTLLGLAVLLPLASFVVILCAAKYLKEQAAWVAICAIGGACVLSFVSMFLWLGSNWPPNPHDHGAAHAPHHDTTLPNPRAEFFVTAPEGLANPHAAKPHESASPTSPSAGGEQKAGQPAPYTGDAVLPGGGPWILGKFGNLRVTISYYVDSLTIVMFCMVTLIATLIHFYAMGYMHDELHDITDHEVHLSNGEDLKRPGRFPRFFQYLSLFCFSMLGLVLAGNIAMVFVFWELVGICSYFLIGFYVERKSASTAANKAFIVNRVGDFGMIIGLLALWSSLGTFAFGDIDLNKDGQIDQSEKGLFSLVERKEMVHAKSSEHAKSGEHPDTSFEIVTPKGMYFAGAPRNEIASLAADHRNVPGGMENAKSEFIARHPGKDYGYWLLVVAGIGIFCGCVGKSAQFPLHTWLPDAMEGPTPVSALVHSATMVAAGVYLVGRFFPVFCPEVLLVICIVGTITLFLAASIAITAVDIKRVLAYSTISQLGYMMLSIGLGGWVAGLMHLITHAFFKSLLFMCSGSVIHAVHTNDMRRMGGLLRKMPVTAITMLVGCLAIAGVGVPFVIGLSGYYSKDAILEQGFLFALRNDSPFATFFFVFAAGGAAMTSFYMFRMWYMTFVGKPRDQHAHDHAHESPPVMYLPLVILATLAVSVAWDWKLIGYGLIAGAFFLAKGLGEGWFKSTKSAHGHDDHGHGHDDHGHGHDDHGHAHAADDHSHAHGTSLTLTPAWTIAMIVTTVIGGWIIQQSLGSTIEGIKIGGHPLGHLTLAGLLEDSRPENTLGDTPARWLTSNDKPWVWPNEKASHADPIMIPVTLLATGTWFAGITLATLMYALGYLNPEDVRRQFSPVYSLLWNKWWFDELYNYLWVKPTFVISRFISGIDKNWIDVFLDSLARFVAWFSRIWEYIADQIVVDGFVNVFAGWTYNLAVTLRQVQTGRLRQYVMFIVLGAIAVFVVVFLFWSPLATAQH